MAYRVGSATSYTSNSQATTSFSINSPVGVASGDIVIIAVLQADTGGTTVPTSSGFTAGDNQHGGAINQGPSFNMSWFYKLAASEPGSYSVTNVPANFNSTMAWCAAWTGRNTTTPITANSKVAVAGGGSPVSIGLTGVTAAASDDLIATAVATDNSTCAWTPPSGFTTGLAIQTSTSFGNAYFAYKDNVSAGATGTITIIETGINTDKLGFLIALANGVVVPPPVPSRGPMPKQIYIMP